MMKSMLVLADGGAKVEAALQTAVAAARRFDAYLDVLHVQPNAEDLIQYGADAAVGTALFGPVIEQTGRYLRDRAARARAAYDKVTAGAEPRVGWQQQEGREAAILAALGRLADLVVISQPGPDTDDLHPESVDTALFATGRPVMVAPVRPLPTIATRVAIAWNDSIQAARAVGAALPFIGLADQVAVLTVERGGSSHMADGLVNYLARNGIAARAESFDAGSSSARARGRALLQRAAAMDADLLVMGAYGDGRMMQFLGLGGATAKVITANTMPLLMAH